MPFNKLYQEKTADELSLLKNKDMSNSWNTFMESMPSTRSNKMSIPQNK